MIQAGLRSQVSGGPWATSFHVVTDTPTWFIQPASEASGLAEGQRARFAREAATQFYPPPTPSGAVGHNPKSGLGQFLGRTSLEMRFTRVGVKSKIGCTTRVNAYVCLALHAGRVKHVKCVNHAILGKIREWHFLTEAPLNSPYPKGVFAKKYTKSNSLLFCGPI